MLLSACINQDIAVAENHPTSDHVERTDLEKRPWFCHFVAIQRPLWVMGGEPGPVLSSYPWFVGMGQPARGALWEDELCTSASVTSFASFNSSLEQWGCSRNVLSIVGINLKEMLDYISHQQILIWRNIVFQQSEVLFGYKQKINSCEIYWISTKYFEFIECDLGCFQESINLKRKWRFLTAYLPVLTNYTL